VGGLPGAAKAGFEVSYWFEAMTDNDWRRMLDALPPGSRVFLRPDHPGLPDLKAWGVWPKHVEDAPTPESATHYLLYGRKASYWLPDPNTGRLAPTDLAVHEARGAALSEVRFLNVRLAAIVQKP
jgi:hypothetical protein